MRWSDREEGKRYVYNNVELSLVFICVGRGDSSKTWALFLVAEPCAAAQITKKL